MRRAHDVLDTRHTNLLGAMEKLIAAFDRST
jgi:hypothetical protein